MGQKAISKDTIIAYLMLILITLSKSSSEVVSMLPLRTIPALLTFLMEVTVSLQAYTSWK